MLRARETASAPTAPPMNSVCCTLLSPSLSHLGKDSTVREVGLEKITVAAGIFRGVSREEGCYINSTHYERREYLLSGHGKIHISNHRRPREIGDFPRNNTQCRTLSASSLPLAGASTGGYNKRRPAVCVDVSLPRVGEQIPDDLQRHRRGASAFQDQPHRNLALPCRAVTPPARAYR